jgi:hypothetical protein
MEICKMAASRFVKVTDKEISEIKINSVQRKHKDLMIGRWMRVENVQFRSTPRVTT